MADNKWSSTYWADLGERVGSTAIYGLIAVLTGDATGAVSNKPEVWWAVVGLPTVLSFLKGVLANLANPESGPSLLPSPPAPEVNDEAGALSVAGAILLLVVVIVVLALVGAL